MFVATYVSNRTQWWALIPGVTLVFLSGMIIVEAFIPQVSEALGGVLVLGGVGVSFLVVYLANRANWWALIPAGVMMTLAVVSVMGNLYGDRYETGGVFFLGLGLTFLLVALLPNPQGSMKWAYIPAVILGIMGVLLLATAAPLVNYFWPIALILVGAVLFVRTLLSRNS
jgi:MFS family permease